VQQGKWSSFVRFRTPYYFSFGFTNFNFVSKAVMLMWEGFRVRRTDPVHESWFLRHSAT